MQYKFKQAIVNGDQYIYGFGFYMSIVKWYK